MSVLLYEQNVPLKFKRNCCLLCWFCILTSTILDEVSIICWLLAPPPSTATSPVGGSLIDPNTSFEVADKLIILMLSVCPSLTFMCRLWWLADIHLSIWVPCKNPSSISNSTSIAGHYLVISTAKIICTQNKRISSTKCGICSVEKITFIKRKKWKLKFREEAFF